MDTPEFRGIEPESFAWVVTKYHARWVKLPLPPKAIAEKVQALRCGLDRDGEWYLSKEQERRFARQEHCRTLKQEGLSKDEPPPFNLEIAHELYKDLFGQFEHLITDRHLIIVPSNVLAQLPFYVLIEKAPEPTANPYPNVRWLVRRSQPITVLPAISSLRALRRLTKVTADRPFIGIGNPLVEGKPNNDESRLAANFARALQGCKSHAGEACPIILGQLGSSTPNDEIGTRQTIIAQVRQWEAVPITACLLCDVAKSLDISDGEIWLGARATITQLKELSEKG